jgi:uncharacterized protein
MRLGSSNREPGIDKFGRTDLHYAANDGDLAQVKRLIVLGSEVNYKDKNGWTPLHFAAQAMNPNIVSLLLSSGAEVNAQDNDGNTPLFRAVFSYRSDGSVIQILRQYGADPFSPNNSGQTPIGLARLISNYDIAKYFND